MEEAPTEAKDTGCDHSCSSIPGCGLGTEIPCLVAMAMAMVEAMGL